LEPNGVDRPNPMVGFSRLQTREEVNGRIDAVVCREKTDRLLFALEPSGETLGFEFRVGLD